MNKRQQKALTEALAKIAEGRQELEHLRDEYQEAFNAKSEVWQEGDKGLALQETIDALQAAIDEIENAEAGLEELQG